MADGLGNKIDKLCDVVSRLDERTEARHLNTCERLAGLEAGVDGVRTAQVEHGKAIAAVQATLPRLSTRVEKHSNELAKLGNGMRDVSQVTAIANVKRAHWRQVAKTFWGVSWKVLLVLGALGLFGTAVAEVFKVLK